MKVSITVLLMALLLSACGNSNVDQSPVNEDRAPVSLATPLLDEGKLTVAFSVRDENNQPLTLTQAPQFGLLKLIPRPTDTGTIPSALEKTIWKSFIHTERRGELRANFETATDYVQTGPGEYSYTFSFNVNEVIDPANAPNFISWDADALHRVVFEYEVEEGVKLNQVIDWVPSGKEPMVTRNLLTRESCDTCHQGEGIKHGGRNDPSGCVACHNESNPDSGRRSLETIVHTKHANHFELIDGEDPTLLTSYEFKETAFPADIRNCDSCHKAVVAGITDDADNWMKQDPQSCQTCHQVRDTQASGAGVDMHIGVGDDWGVANCTDCHTAENANHSVVAVHKGRIDKLKQARDTVAVTVESLTYEAPNIIAQVRVTKDGQGVASIVDINQYNTESGKFYLLLNWDNGKGAEISYGNTQLNMLTGTAPDYTDACEVLGDGLFRCIKDTTDMGKQPQDDSILTLNTVEVVFCADRRSGTLKACADLANEKPDSKPWLIAANNSRISTDASGIVVDHKLPVGASQESCSNCHGELSIHDTRHGSIDMQQCVNCHNAERAAYYNGFPADLKYHVHSFHAFGSHRQGPKTDSYPYGVATTDYPGATNNCEGCHTAEQYNLPNQQNARPSLAKVPVYADDGSIASWEAKYFSPALVACGACHISYEESVDGDDYKGVPLGAADINSFPLDHMIRNGGVFGADNAADATGTEQCASCHAVGQIKGVDAVHKIYNYR